MEAKAPEAASSLESFRGAATFEMARPSREEVEEAMEHKPRSAIRLQPRSSRACDASRAR
jgi:hypothetical protein